MKSWLQSAGSVVSAALTAFALVMDFAGFLPGLDWRWVALGGFSVFAGLMIWRVRELQSDLDEVRGNQALELSVPERTMHKLQRPDVGLWLPGGGWTV